MTDDRIPPDELASAALDNEVSDDERATAAITPGVAEQISVYAKLRSQIADVTVPDDARERAMAAAMGAFQLHDDEEGSFAPSASVTPLSARRRRPSRWFGGLAAAAAVAALAVAGAVGLAQRSDNDEPSATATKASVASEAESFDASAGDAPADDASGASDVREEAPATSIEPSIEASENPSAASDSTVDGGFQMNAPVPTPLPVLQSEADVLAFASNLTSDTEQAIEEATEQSSEQASAASTVASNAAPASPAADVAATVAACELTAVGPSAPATYLGLLVTVVRDDQRGEVLVVDASTCEVVATFAQ